MWSYIYIYYGFANNLRRELKYSHGKWYTAKKVYAEGEMVEALGTRLKIWNIGMNGVIQLLIIQVTCVSWLQRGIICFCC